MDKVFSFPVRVYYEDTDAGGVVYYANYLKYFERGRTELLRTIGFEQDDLIRDMDVIFAVRAIQAEYLLPARFNDQLTVQTKIGEMKRASLEFIQKIIRNDDKQTLCTFTAQVACLQASTLKPRAIPGEIVKQAEVA